MGGGDLGVVACLNSPPGAQRAYLEQADSTRLPAHSDAPSVPPALTASRG